MSRYASSRILCAFAAALFLFGSVRCSLAGPPAGYYLVWSDEFNGTSLNTNNWSYWKLGKWNDAYNVTNAVTFNGSNAIITIYSDQGTNYSAMLASQFHFHPRYGYYESSIMWGNSNGNWSAFWLRSPTMGTYLDDAYVSGGEMDVCEHRYVGIYATNYIGNIVSDNIHWDGYGTAEQNSGSPNVGNVATGFHSYGLLWNLGTYSFSIDGSEVWNASATATPPFGSDAYILLSSEVNQTSTTWAGFIPSNGYPSQATSPLKMTIDYCRYYAPSNVLFWTGANSAYWSNSANWVSNLAPGAGTDLTFSYMSSNLNMVLGTDQTVDGLIFLETPTNISISGANTLKIGAGGIDMVPANQNVTLGATINIGSNQTWTIGRNNPGNRLTVTGNLTGTAILTKAGYGTLALSGTNSFSGVLNVDTGSSVTNDGAVLITNTAAIANVPSPIRIRNSGQAASTLQVSNNITVLHNIVLAGRSSGVAGVESLSGTNALAGGLMLTGGGSTYGLQSDAGLFQLTSAITTDGNAPGTCIVTFQGAGDILIPIAIQNSGSSVISLARTNSGTLTLTGHNTYTGVTTNWSGNLVVNGSIASQLVIMGGSVAGTGTISGDTLVLGGGISPGAAASNSIGTIYFSGNVTCGAGAVTTMELNAATQTNDQLNVAGTLTCGGLLYVTNLAGNFTLGQSFKLFNAGNLTGTFSALALPFLSAGLAWNTNSLTNGILSITIAPRPPAPTSAYAMAIRALQPVGYWPLQETNAQASMTIETNLGSLGALGNAYYLDTNQADVALGTAGALAADSDTSVAFNSAAQTFAFVPRISPLLTLIPPFTLESWFNPQSAVYGVILGEGGGASLNGGPTYGGFQFAWAGNNKSRFEMQFYKYGINSSTTFDTPSGYTNNLWYHYVVTYDALSNSVIYVNGQPIITNAIAYVADTWSPLTIGNGKWNGVSATRGVNGTIDEVAIYTNLISPAEIANHYSTGTNSAPATSYKQLVLSDHPLIYLRMDNSGAAPLVPVYPPLAANFGSAPVDGQYLAGTVPAVFAGPSGAGLGSGSTSAGLNGLFSAIDAGYDSTFNPTNSQPFTAMLWFKGYPADSAMQTLMGRGSNSWSLNVDGSTGKVVWNSGAGSVTSSTIFNDGAWHQAAGVYNGSTNLLYVDGALQASVLANGTIAGNTNHLYLGGDPSYTLVFTNEHYFAGAIAHASLFNAALSQSQIQTAYQAAVNPPPMSLSIQTMSGHQAQLNWNYGSLQSAPTIAEPYGDISAASPPYTIPATNAQAFYRLRR